MVRIKLSILLFTEVFLRLSLGIGSLQPNAAPFDVSQLEYTSEPTTLVVNGEHMLDGAAFHARYPISRKADIKENWHPKIPGVYLGVLSDNEHAIALYEKIGFELKGQIYFQNETVPTLGYVYRFDSSSARDLPKRVLAQDIELNPTSDLVGQLKQ
ncbi:hypothetical protein Pmar_PMAR022347 [Perkinsus marinus ATCC 50983]|uniref:Uncharacterized protein n=1 Tax=Perkinsus marinus (strain ATCC 50983 / TXsc) TaxID=423536 RepID=C5KDU4_PERM5|nr:hypothetical protein Pmar_PMAR022347 [Perkinsus marinus ATCC 50983]EER17397.1 hypothetical protein Pmar_PMAR022347 [Perkinsus marinus ATCC 50983]|eukprot:XP_002785601.1 hypothetical protein Pmar_PMAR022347 [Perkinsus marinus ATCC 50983]